MSGEIEIREGDVFSFAYKDEILEAAEAKTYRGRLRHCFDGQLVATVFRDGEMRLVDTYWSDNSSKSFTVEEAANQGILTFRFNIGDVEKAYESVKDYYAREDWFDFSHQHGCYKRFVLKKGAQKSKDRMLAAITERLEKASWELESANRRINQLCADRLKVESGDLSVYL